MAASGKWIEGIGGQTSVEEAARRSLEPRLAAVVRCLPVAAHLAEHDIEHVHRLRVATRRAVAALDLYDESLASKPARWMKKRLRQIRRAAADARDLDVLAIRLAQEYGEAAATIVELITAQRATVRPAIVKIADRCLRDDRFIRKISKLLDGVRMPTLQDHSEQEPAEFGHWAAEQLSKLAPAFLAAMPGQTSDVAALHQFRIRAKELRYAIELVAPVFGPELRDDLYPMIEELQERLGRVQDHVTARQLFQKLASKESSDPRRQILCELADAEARRMTQKVDDFHGWWTGDRDQRVRAALAAATSPLQAENQTSRVG